MKRRLFMFAAPAIVAAPSLMKLSSMAAALIKPEPLMYFRPLIYSTTGASSWYLGYETLAEINRITGITDLMR